MLNKGNHMLIVTHKPIADKITEENYSYISVGRKCDGIELSDNDGNNISSKNANFCELTALYWAWKNTSLKSMGLCHYRRFFCVINNGHYEIAPVKGFLKDLEEYDIILPKTHKFYTNYYKFYEMCQSNDALCKCCDLLRRNDPSYAKIIKEMKRERNYHCFNMFYAKKELIDRYCEWLFRLLFEFEKQIDITDWTFPQQRVFGYLSEFLLNLWVRHENLKVKEYEVARTQVFPCSIKNVANVFENMTLLNRMKLKILCALWPALRLWRVKKC